MKRLTAILLCVVASAIIATFLVVQSVEKRDAFLPSTVKVTTQGGHGSGVHLGDGYILTAAHVIENAKDIKVRAQRGSETSVDVLWINKEYDVALLRARDLIGVSASRLSCRNPKVGEPVEAAGNPGPLEFIHSYGNVSSASDDRGMWKSAYIASITIAPGSSGGPLFDKDGHVIGLTVGVAITAIGFSPSVVGYSYVVGGSAICMLMARA